jgi:CubicO group peptidase (beta-lactamase class C family)
MMKWPKHGLGRAFLAAAIMVTGGCATASVDDRAAEEAVYMKRYQAQAEAAQQGGGLPAYDTLEPVAGAAEIDLIPTAASDISNSAMATARTFAADRNTSAFLVWHKGALVEETYFGEYDRIALINSKSLAKPITAIVIGRAIAEGHVQSLDQPVADFITEWQSDTGKSKILIRHLLDMRTGLLAQGNPTGPEDVLQRAYLHPRHDQVIIDEYPLINPPGTRYEYANANSELIAPLIKRATGMRYADYLTKMVLEPLGAAGGTVFVNRPDGTAHSGCCIQLPAQTYLKLGILLLQDGVWDGTRLLPEGYVAAMRTPTRENPHAGLGVWMAEPYIERRGSLNPGLDIGRTLHSEPYAASDLFLFDGNSHQVVYIVPSKNLVILRTGSYPPKDRPWDNSVIPNSIIGGIQAERGDAPPIAHTGAK